MSRNACEARPWGPWATSCTKHPSCGLTDSASESNRTLYLVQGVANREPLHNGSGQASTTGTRVYHNYISTKRAMYIQFLYKDLLPRASIVHDPNLLLSAASPAQRLFRNLCRLLYSYSSAFFLAASFLTSSTLLAIFVPVACEMKFLILLYM